MARSRCHLPAVIMPHACPTGLTMLFEKCIESNYNETLRNRNWRVLGPRGIRNTSQRNLLAARVYTNKNP